MARNGSADCAAKHGFLGPVPLKTGTLSSRTSSCQFTVISVRIASAKRVFYEQVTGVKGLFFVLSFL
jgi:hypothetical protein